MAALANPGSYQGGDRLVLKVDKRSGATWLLRVQQDGKRRDIGNGSVKLLTLAEARHQAAGLRKAIKVDQRASGSSVSKITPSRGRPSASNAP